MINSYFNNINIIFQIITLLSYYYYDIEYFLIIRFIILFCKNELFWLKNDKLLIIIEILLRENNL